MNRSSFERRHRSNEDDALVNENPAIDEAVRKVLAGCELIAGRAKRAGDMCRHPGGSPDVIVIDGQEREKTDPRHEAAFDWLDQMGKIVEDASALPL